MRRATAALLAGVGLAVVVLSGCSTGAGVGGSAGSGGVIQVVAAENFWGSIAAAARG